MSSFIIFIINVCWAVLWIYWLVSSFFAKPSQERVGWLRGYWHWILMIIAYGLLFNNHGHFIKDQSSIILLLGDIFTVIGCFVAISARRTLAGNWSGEVSLKKNHELVTKGIYSSVRHPIYTGLSLMYIGTLLIFQTVSGFIGFIILLVTFLVKIKMEEELMIQHFPKEYPAYKKRTKLLIPFLW